VVESAALTASATAAVGHWDAAEMTGMTGFTALTTTTQSSKYNGYTLTTTKSLGAGANVGAVIDNTAKTITLNFSSDVAAGASNQRK
jgi:hypothetical protein